jgi:hypothetical protein
MQEWQEKIEQQVEHLKEEVKQLREQRTEEIKVTRIEVASEDVIRRLDTLKQDLTQELHTVSNTWLETLQEHYTEHTEALSDVKTVQSGHSKFFEEHGKRLAATATKDDLAVLKDAQDTRFDKLESDVSSIKSTQEQILKLLQQKQSE